MDFETPGDADTLELVSPLFIGGLDANVEAVFLPPVLWSAGFKRGFVGCLRDLVINGQYIYNISKVYIDIRLDLRNSRFVKNCHLS